MPLGEGVGKVNRGGQEKLDDGRTSPSVWIREGSLSPLEVEEEEEEEWGPMSHITTTHLHTEMELAAAALLRFNFVKLNMKLSHRSSL